MSRTPCPPGAGEGSVTEAALAARDLTRRFGGLVAVNKVSLDLHARELHALIGTNGAGKSTLINLLAGELKPSAGNWKSRCASPPRPGCCCSMSRWQEWERKNRKAWWSCCAA